MRHKQSEHHDIGNTDESIVYAELVENEEIVADEETIIEFMRCPVCLAYTSDFDCCPLCSLESETSLPPKSNYSGEPVFDLFFVGMTCFLLWLLTSVEANPPGLFLFVLVWLSTFSLAVSYGSFTCKGFYWFIVCFRSYIIPSAWQFGFFGFSLLPGVIAWYERKFDLEKTKAIRTKELEIRQVELKREEESKRLEIDFLNKSTNTTKSLSNEKSRDFEIYRNALLEIEQLIRKHAPRESQSNVVKFKCMKCNKSLKSHERFANRRVTCPKCKNKTKVPEQR